MLEMIHARKTAEKKEERYDLFSSLLDASEEEDDAALTDRELLGMRLESERTSATKFVLSCSSRQHLHFPSGWSRGLSKHLLARYPPSPDAYNRPQPTRWDSHFRFSRYTRTSRKSCINISKVC